MTLVKSQAEIAVMAEGGRKLGEILQKILEFSKPGTALLEIETLASNLVAATDGSASFKTVKGYKWATCLCVNEVVVHGIPTNYILKDGDILTIDIGLLYKGFHTDTAWTKIVKNEKSLRKDSGQVKVKSEEEEEKEKFLKIGEEALWKAIDKAKVGNRIGHISEVIQSTIEGGGYSVVRTLVGHGVGRELHEAPQVPGLLKIPLEETLPLVENMTLAVEVIYAMGKPEVVYDNDDGWTIATKDRSLSAVFEHTVAITTNSPIILTHSAGSESTLSSVEGLTK